MMLINGQPGESISAHDRGLHYGDGLFETLRVRDGLPLHWGKHMRRLVSGCGRLGIPVPDDAQLHAEALSLCEEARQAVLKVIITRGSGGRGYRASLPIMPTRIISLHPWPEHIETHASTGVTVRVCATRLGNNPQLAGMKHLNRLEQVLARNEWDDPAIAEGLVLDGAGWVIEGTMSNIFVIRDGVLYTPDLSAAGVAGIMRERILELAAEIDIACQVTSLTLETILDAQEVFLCNSIIGIWPVRRLVTVHYPIGPLTRRLMIGVSDDA